MASTELASLFIYWYVHFIFCATTSLQKLIHLQTLNLHHLDIRPRRSFIKFAKASKFTTFPNLCRHISTTNHDQQNTTFQLLVFTLFILTGTVCNTFFSSNIYKRSKYVYQYSEFVKFIWYWIEPEIFSNIETNQSFISSLVRAKHRSWAAKSVFCKDLNKANATNE